MNTKHLLVLSLAGCISAQAGVTDNYLDRLSPKAREFVEKYKAEKANKKVEKKKVVSKNDVLGRKLKQGQNQDSTVYLVENAVEPKMEVTVYDLTVEDPDIEPLGPAHYSYNDETKEENFWLNGKKIDKKSFFKKTEEWENRRMKLLKPLKEPYKAFLTPTEMERKLQSSENIYIETEESVETANYYDAIAEDGVTSTHVALYNEALETSQLSTAFAYGDKGNDVGIYYVDTGCADESKIPNPNKHEGKACNRPNKEHATKVATVLQKFAPNAYIYGYDRQNIENTLGPSNPMGSAFNPKIYVGSVSIGLRNESSQHTTAYEINDARLDDYIYNYGVTEFVNAGNFTPSEQTQRAIHSPGKALNAITVGALDPKALYIYGNPTYEGKPFYFYEPYSNYLNSVIGDAKPEIMNIGNFYFPEMAYTTYSGTSFSTPFTAAMAADMMSRHPFFKGHPEMVKPVFLTSTWGFSLNDPDTDGGAYHGAPVYSLLALNKTYSGYWPRAKDNVLFKDNKSLEMNISGLVAGEKYKLAVSWLMKGSTIKNKGKMPVNLAVVVLQNGQLISSFGDINNKNPYVLLSFTVPQSGSIKIYIGRIVNYAANEDIAIGYHMARQP